MDLIQQILMAIATAGVSYFLGYKQNKANVESVQLDNLEKSIKIYQTIIQDLSSKVENLSNQVVKLEIQIDALMKENKQLKNRIR